MHFIFLVNTYNGFGGAERQGYILATYLKNKIGVKVSFISYNKDGIFKKMLNEAEIDTYSISFEHKSKLFQKVKDYIKIVFFIRKLKPDVLIPYVFESNKIVAQIWKYTGARFAFWNQREEGRNLNGTSLEKKLIRSVSAVVSNSYEGRDALVRVYGLSSDNIKVINNGIVPYDGFIDSYNWHAHFNLKKNRPIISMIANVKKRKDHKTLLEAWSLIILELKQKNQPLPFLVLAGRKDNEYDNMRLLGFELKLCEHIGFTGNIKQVQGLIEQSYFCVFSSNLEGCPNGVLECMERGKAVVGTNISGIQQALGTDYRDYCLSQPNDAQDLANKILSLYDNQLLIKEIGEYNKNRIRTEFSVDQMVSKYLDLFCDKIGLVEKNIEPKNT